MRYLMLTQVNRRIQREKQPKDNTDALETRSNLAEISGNELLNKNTNWTSGQGEEKKGLPG